jgi:succinate dehydrogenase/fumarate reductase flavoprotein subunit
MGSSRFGERLFGRLLGHHAARYAASISGSIFIGLSRAIERHRQAYDVFMDTWGQTNWATVYDRIKTDEEAAARHRRYCELETAEEEAFHALLATRPTTKAGVIVCVEHVADCGLATDEMRAWLAMLVQSPLAS